MRGLNILGLTPLELAVDLGRNDISFLLLSMRDGDSSSRSATRTGNGAGATGAGGTGQADALLRGASAPRAASRPRIAAASSGSPPEPSAGEQPRLYSGNGGAPIPAAGFVGFDPGRTVR
jgi:hypothetical protein